MALSLRCVDCGAQLRSVKEAQDHGEATGHSNFEESTEAILTMVRASGVSFLPLADRAPSPFFHSPAAPRLFLSNSPFSSSPSPPPSDRSAPSAASPAAPR